MANTTWNPETEYLNGQNSFDITNNGLTLYSSGTLEQSIMASNGVAAGKRYFECTVSSLNNAGPMFGVSILPCGNWSSTNERSYCINGKKYYTADLYGATWTAGDVIGIYFDADKHSVGFTKNGVDQGIAYEDVPTGIVYPYYNTGGSGTCRITANFGATAFNHAPPSDYLAWNTANQNQSSAAGV